MLKPALILSLIFFLAVSCARNEQNVAITPATVTAVPEITAATPTPTSTATIVPSPTATVPTIAVADQIITDEGNIAITSVVSNEPGWVVVYQWQNGELGEVLGHTAVDMGFNNDLIVIVDPLLATPTLAAILHVDQGEPGSFEFPDGPDVPLIYESAQIATTFMPEFQLSTPIITISDQEVLEDGLIHVDSVLAQEEGWLVLHADDNGQLGQYLGSTPIVAGLNESLQIHIPWRQGTSTLHAVIYEDNGREHRLDIPGEDIPKLINGTPVVKTFSVTYPPDLFVLDQPIVDGKFKVERAISNGPGWLVVYFDNEGEPGLIIGYAPLADGINEDIEVEIVETAVTNPLHLRLHEDSEPGDDFDFPRVDPPVVYDGRQLRPYQMNSDPGNYLIVQDQSVAENAGEVIEVLVPTAVVNQPGWVVIHADDDGRRGDILGFAPLPAGLSQNIVVEIPAAGATDTLYAVLHLDAGEIGEFEYPNGDDVPLQRNRRFLEIPFQLLAVPEVQTE